MLVNFWKFDFLTCDLVRFFFVGIFWNFLPAVVFLPQVDNFVIFPIFLKGINKWPLFYLFIFSQEWYITCICIFIIPKRPHAQYCVLNLEPLHTNRVLAYFSLWLVMMLQMTELYFVNSSGWINVGCCMYTFIFIFITADTSNLIAPYVC